MRDTLTLSEGIARFISSQRESDIPDAVIDDAVLRVIDTVGVALRAYELEGATIPARFAAQIGGKPESTIFGSAIRTSPVIAAFANGSLAHWPDFDDTDSDSMLHPSSVAVPTALALAESLGRSGRACLAAIVIGAEVGLRIARLGRHQFQKRGYHATGACGPFVAAAVAGRLLQLDEFGIASALGIAGCLSAGLLQGHSDGSWAKRFYSGWASHTGVTAAMLAADGAVGSREILEGGAGFYRVLLGDFSETSARQELTDGLGERWSLSETTFKPYPSAAWTHSSIDGILAIMRSENLSADAIESIECRLPAAAIPLVCEPREAKVRPKSTYHMKFSEPFTVAMAAIFGRIDMSDFTQQTLIDSRVLALADRVTCTADSSLSARGFPAIVKVSTRSGKTYAREILAQRGGPGNPMSQKDLLAKFEKNAGGLLGPVRTKQLMEKIMRLPETLDVRAMMDLTHE